MISCPALCRDEIKEGMVASNPGFVPTPKDPLMLRTYHLFFDTIALLLRGEVTVVAEAGFQHALWWPKLEPLIAWRNYGSFAASCPAGWRGSGLWHE